MTISPVEIVKVLTLALVVPLSVFAANWIYRGRKEYNQTAAADLILALIIFDATVGLSAKDFEGFVRTPELLPLLNYCAYGAAVVAGLMWCAIGAWGEPALARYYRERGWQRHRRFPYGTFLLCWMGIFILIASHTAFFVIKSGSGGTSV